MKSKTTCYMCEAAETSREHSPPSCLFPVMKDIGRDLRQNLVTVPSCDDHNSKKCKDDEFLRALILHVAVQSSEIAQNQFMGKLLRAAKRKPHTYSNFFTDEGTLANGSLRALRIDRGRFDRCIDHLMRALYFDTYKEKWVLPILVTSPSFFSNIENDNAVPHQPIHDAVDVTKEFLKHEIIKGQNPEVFKYRVRYDEATRIYAFAAIFYDFFEVYSLSSPDLTGAVLEAS